jgi:hypothetical protein
MVAGSLPIVTIFTYGLTFPVRATLIYGDLGNRQKRVTGSFIGRLPDKATNGKTQRNQEARFLGKHMFMNRLGFGQRGLERRKTHPWSSFPLLTTLLFVVKEKQP